LPLTCPSDIPNAPVTNTDGTKLTSHNYVVNLGNTTEAQTTYNSIIHQGAPFKIARLIYPNDATVTVQTPGGWNVRPYKGTNFAEILDGLSNTMLMAECLQGTGTDLRGFTWWGNAAGFTAYNPPNSTLPDTVASNCTNRPELNLPCVVGSSSSTYNLAARSRHPGGVQVLMADGSARFVQQSVSIITWRAVSTSRGGETATLDN
jgi:prepilin-type processing-associated H-X9-DG protein